MIHVTVRAFGPATDVLGNEPIAYDLTAPARLGGLADMLFAKYPELARASEALRFAVNEEYAVLDTELADGDEIAIIPPVAGGAPPVVALTAEPIDPAELVASVEDPDCGGIATFLGVVRAEGPPDNPLAALEYSAHATMALEQMRRLRDRAVDRFALGGAAVAHRVGRLAIGEIAVAIAVAAPHRTEAFEACRWIIDELKRDVPIWKKEVWTRGEASWVEPGESEGATG